MYAIKSKRTGRFYSEYHNDWMNAVETGCEFSSIDEANDVAEMYCDRNSYEIVRIV